MIPTHKFEFVDLSDLFSLASANANVEYPEFSTGFSLTINYTLDMHFSTINRITCFVFVISHMYSLLFFFYYLSKMLLVCLRILNTYQKLRLFMEKRIQSSSGLLMEGQHTNLCFFFYLQAFIFICFYIIISSYVNYTCRHSHKVTVWGNLAVNTDAAYRATVERPIIVIVSSTKLKTFRSKFLLQLLHLLRLRRFLLESCILTLFIADSVQISTLPSSKIYLNLDNEVVHAMKQRFSIMFLFVIIQLKTIHVLHMYITEVYSIK